MAEQGSPAFAELVDQFVCNRCELDPFTATFLGFREWDHRVCDTSPAGWRHRDERNRHWLETFRAIDPATLSDADQIDRELILARVAAETATSDFQQWRRGLEQYTRNGVFELFVHRARPEPEAVAAAIARLARVPETVADARANLSAELADPVILTRDLRAVEGAADFMRSEVGSFVEDPALRARLEAAAAPAAAAYDDLATGMRALSGRAHGSFVFGEQRYDTLLRVGGAHLHRVELARDGPA